MASNTLFPPVVNNVEPAFITSPIVGTEIDPNTGRIRPVYEQQPGELRVYFKFSALNAGLDESNISVQATVHLKSSGASIVEIEDGEKTTAQHDNGTFLNTYRLRATQIILNLKPVHVENTDFWYITLVNKDIYQERHRHGDGVNLDYFGWEPGEIYKIQIRLSEVLCTRDEDIIYQQKWLYENADRFSEWSEIIYSKCISSIKLTHLDDYEGKFYIQDIPSQPAQVSYPQIFQGRIECIDSMSNEHYSSCSLKVYESDNEISKGNLIEDVTLYPNDISMDNYNYTIKYNFIADANIYYYLEFSFITDNKYQSEIIKCWFQCSNDQSQICDYKITTVDTSNHSLVEKIKDNKKYYTSLGKENDNGCIGIKIEYDDDDFIWNQGGINLCIVRTDEYSDFTIWEDIKNINLNFDPAPESKEELISMLEKLPIYYDYTIESNIFYQYGIQSYFKDAYDVWRRTHIKKLKKGNSEAKIQRDFEYSYLLGQDQKQLKIKFNDNISSYIHQVYDNKLEPVGSQFPYINRNSKINYRTFPIAGTISFEMDDNETFLHNGSLDIYKYIDVDILHENDSKTEDGASRYNYGYERRFRQKVLEFLYNENYKLFKSATEGNIIIRLRDISCAPNQQISRLIYNFSATADEMDINTMDNLKKYGLIYPGTYVTTNIIPPIPIPSDPADPPGWKQIDLPHSHGASTSSIITPENIPPKKDEEKEEGN